MLDAHTYTHTPGHHHAITSVSVSLTYLPSCLGQETANEHMVCKSLPPMSTTPRQNLYNVPSMLNVKQGSCEYQFLKSFGMTRLGNEPGLPIARQTLLQLHHCSYHYTIIAHQVLQNPQAAMLKY